MSRKILPQILQSFYYNYDNLEQKLEKYTSEQLNEILDSCSCEENDEYPFNLDFLM